VAPPPSTESIAQSYDSNIRTHAQEQKESTQKEPSPVQSCYSEVNNELVKEEKAEENEESKFEEACEAAANESSLEDVNASNTGVKVEEEGEEEDNDSANNKCSAPVNSDPYNFSEDEQPSQPPKSMLGSKDRVGGMATAAENKTALDLKEEDEGDYQDGDDEDDEDDEDYEEEKP
jgi:hypothetical protein